MFPFPVLWLVLALIFICHYLQTKHRTSTRDFAMSGGMLKHLFKIPPWLNNSKTFSRVAVVDFDEKFSDCLEQKDIVRLKDRITNAHA